jgi:hypothetical protein
MSTYKVIQDIEAEDHILGPLSLRQFIYAIIAVTCLYFCYFSISHHVLFLLPIFLPPALFTGFFAAPWGRDQPTEVWALAKVRFLVKSRKRIWDQSGVKELVTITVPKRVEEHLTNGLSQNEVASRLSALANTIDSRGWAIKNVNVNLYSEPSSLTQTVSDRLIDPSSMPQDVPTSDIQASDDILDERNNPIAQQFDQMITASTQAHHQQMVDQMNSPTLPSPESLNPPQDYWFLNQPIQAPVIAKDQTVFTNAQVVTPVQANNAPPVIKDDATPDEEALANQLRAKSVQPQKAYSHMQSLQPLSTQHPAPPKQVQPPMTHQPDAAILELANNNDLNVATLARQANKVNDTNELSQDEVVISLH